MYVKAEKTASDGFLWWGVWYNGVRFPKATLRPSKEVFRAPELWVKIFMEGKRLKNTIKSAKMLRFLGLLSRQNQIFSRI